ncbi:MAG: SpoIIE family protein phosphatase [Aeromicrobium sp.]|uniref:PP2C family protein-serine/threonine phosphatase n=1 Tax=Aeromicrobium sp. TaxID=1871063 RepID=UPI002633476F|nr:SpoIIE family protein phosphatase [Aeromicrobium sp.]MDF1706005.1 SpoIIE family protein phosphatase [Aeromicrobium sp.]
MSDHFEAAPCGYVLVGQDGVIQRANAEFRRLVDREHEELVGAATLESLLSTGGRIYAETHLRPMLQHDGWVREVALDLVRPDHTRVPVLFNADTMTGEGPAFRAVVVETRERHRYEQDLRDATQRAERSSREAHALANALQRTLIPPAPPEVPFLQVAAAYRPAGDGSVVGGDFYDVFQVGPADWWVVLGDVSGKGIGAATVTSFVRHTVRALAFDHPDPAELLHELDRALHLDNTDHYCTVVLARLSRVGAGWTMCLALAGHPPALVRSSDGRVSELGILGTPVGLIADPSFTTVRHELRDETITFYTDGVTEAGGRADLFGEDRLHALLAKLPPDPAVVVEQLAQQAVQHQGGVAVDDIAVISFAPSDDASPH